MKIFVAATYEMMSQQAADGVIDIMNSRKQPLICTASGDSPAGLYKEFVNRTSKIQVNVSDWFFVGLDEWVGLNETDEGSCRYHLNQQLFHPLQIQDDRICFFDGKAKDLDSECEKTENFIHEHGGIDVAIVGLGMNGHVGMNEPGTSTNTYSHITNLDSTTQKVGQKYFQKEQKLSRGITLGLATLMEARNIFLLISGRHKAEIAQKIIEDEISERLPASLLRRHTALKVFMDADAASRMIQS